MIAKAKKRDIEKSLQTGVLEFLTAIRHSPI